MKYFENPDFLQRMDELLELNQFGSNNAIARTLISEFDINANEDTVRKHVKKMKVNKHPDILEQNVRLKKQSQKLQDTNRIERKSFREYARIENALEEYTSQLREVFDNNPIEIKTKQHKSSLNNCVGVVHITDTHFNELVELASNTYDFTVASQRLQKHIFKSKEYFKGKGIKNILLALTGDLLNSDRRLDELLSMATNRSKATFLAVQILENVILDLNKDFNVHVASIVGNESRVGKDVGWSNILASDSYDLTIYNILSYHLKDRKGIEFLGGDTLEKVVEVAGHNWLLIHGHQSGFGASPEKAVSKLVRRFADIGIIIRFVAFGHIHEALIGDLYSRGGSQVGANAYSEKGLMLTSRASGNTHIAYENGEIDSIKIDLQEVKGFDGYPIQKELEAYNAKSASKAAQKETILKVVI